MAESYVTARSLVDLPPNHSIVIRACAEQLKGTLGLQRYTNTILDVARYIYIATLALAKDTWMLTKAREALFQVLNMCNTSLVLVQQMQRGVVENLKSGNVVLFDGDPEGIRAVIEGVETGMYDLNGAIVNTRNGFHNLLRKIESLQEVNLSPELLKVEKELEGAAVREGEEEEESGSGEEIDDDTSVIWSPRENTLQVEEMFDSPWSWEIKLPRRYSNCLIPSVIVTFFLVALLMINQYLSVWGMVAGTYPPLIYLVLILHLGQMTVVILAIRKMSQVDHKLEVGNYRYFLPYAPLAVFFVFAGIVVIIYELSELKNKPDDKAFIVVLAMPLLVIQMLLFVVVGFWSYWGYRRKGDHVPSLDWDPMVGEIEDDREGGGVLGTKGRSVELVEGLVGESGAGEKGHLQLLEERRLYLALSLAVLHEAVDRVGDSFSSLEGLMPAAESWVVACISVFGETKETAAGASVTMEKEPSAITISEEYKKAIDEYYCRWRALEVYGETVRRALVSAQETIEQYYDADPHPNEALLQAIDLAAAEEAVPAIQEVVKSQEQQQL
ncbi:uncharacterized protein LOC135497893 [Lineus longissimus]|uniref:uncharacterized protein LOC135497893 n=1 Tax=Lineus longissimus TaxID=88925 RepID=UPI002B4CE0D3